MAELFKVYSGSTRVKVLCALQHSEMCVCDIAVLLGMTKSAISHQLRVLRHARLVKYRKEGKVVYYSLDDAFEKSCLLGHLLEAILVMLLELQRFTHRSPGASRPECLCDRDCRSQS
jgi:DNA-binding transcriptional ArsR family regulator